ncbi:Gfo/Idh/MocA family oxidoreductase [Enterococcus faecalis]|uniref:Gfo/Idh/MocA family oxidoreductase n=1 Tax=Enterococcus faecalis TaxID=1351 RepID=UPI003D6AA828
MIDNKHRILICGANFGEIYVSSLYNSNKVDLVGIFAQGGQNSERVSKKYRIPIYTKFEDLPEDIDLAYVIVKTSLGGGQGYDIAKQLLTKGIAVIIEQPIHYNEYVELVREAKKNNTYVSTSNFYKYIDDTGIFLKCLNEIIKNGEKVEYININCGNQFIPPVVQILQEIVGSFKNYSIKGNIVAKNIFDVIQLTIGDINCTISVHNESDALDIDNNFQLFYKIQVGFSSGTIELADPSGPIMWLNRFYIQKKWKDKKSFDTISDYRVSNHVEVYGSGQKISNILDIKWKEAICAQTEESFIIKTNDWDTLMQKNMDCLLFQGDLYKIIGTPREISVIKSNNPKGFIKEILFKNLLDGGKTDYILQNLTKKSVEKKIKTINSASLLSIADCFLKMNILKDNMIDLGSVCENSYGLKQQRILKIMIKYLYEYGWITENGLSIDTQKELRTNSVTDAWNSVEQEWIGSLASREIIGYYRQHGENLFKIMMGKLTPNLLLFPEGDSTRAKNFYSYSLIGRYLNLMIGKIIRDLNCKDMNILELGAGTGVTTKAVLSSRLVKKYIFSDKSKYFLNNAEKQFEEYPLEYKIIDMDFEFKAQGIESQSVDVVIVAGAINNVKDSNFTLKNINYALKDGGYLLLAEPVSDLLELVISQSFLMEIPRDSRNNKNILFYKEKDWIKLLKSNGFRLINIYPETNSILNPLNQRLFFCKKESTNDKS